MRSCGSNVVLILSSFWLAVAWIKQTECHEVWTGWILVCRLPDLSLIVQINFIQ